MILIVIERMNNFLTWYTEILFLKIKDNRRFTLLNLCSAWGSHTSLFSENSENLEISFLRRFEKPAQW